MRKTRLFLFCLFFWIFEAAAVNSVYARLLPQAKTTAGKINNQPKAGFYLSPRLRPDRKAVIINFGGLSKISSLNYVLSYETEGKSEGARGTVKYSGNGTDSRTLLFGTCSSGVCRYHTGIKNVKLEFDISLTSGQSLYRRYRIRV